MKSLLNAVLVKELLAGFSMCVYVSVCVWVCMWVCMWVCVCECIVCRKREPYIRSIALRPPNSNPPATFPLLIWQPGHHCSRFALGFWFPQTYSAAIAIVFLRSSRCVALHFYPISSVLWCNWEVFDLQLTLQMVLLLFLVPSLIPRGVWMAHSLGHDWSLSLLFGNTRELVVKSSGGS